MFLDVCSSRFIGRNRPCCHYRRPTAAHVRVIGLGCLLNVIKAWESHEKSTTKCNARNGSTQGLLGSIARMRERVHFSEEDKAGLETADGARTHGLVCVRDVCVETHLDTESLCVFTLLYALHSVLPAPWSSTQGQPCDVLVLDFRVTCARV
ncbi:hypothetical protein DM02DRAFT_52672 [Periconia macrospinosa]|uniref:Uncharacterized protein n=1 Tax=Periconia macrospinosa TaxID=97972 RepID=A0A2V1DLS6_9PLEO|nr:hypothetical protein DM02DRAFT_52672 [Periconia macrospinosa]